MLSKLDAAVIIAAQVGIPSSSIASVSKEDKSGMRWNYRIKGEQNEKFIDLSRPKNMSPNIITF